MSPKELEGHAQVMAKYGLTRVTLGATTLERPVTSKESSEVETEDDYARFLRLSPEKRDEFMRSRGVR